MEDALIHRQGWVNKRISFLAMFVPVLCMWTSGCSTSSPLVHNVPASPPSDRPMITPVTMAVGRSVHGRSIDAVILGDPTAPCAALFMATIHGNEPAGTPLMYRLVRVLAAAPEQFHREKVIILPVVNPDGLAAFRRTNARGIDLNRNFAAMNHRANHRSGPIELSEPEANAIADLIERERPRIIVSLHQPLSCVDYDGPGRELAELMSQATGLPIRKLGARPGSLGSFAGVDLELPIITLELPGAATNWSDDELWDRYGHALLVALRYAMRVQSEVAGDPVPSSR